MNARLERILDKLAQRYAPHLIPSGWENLAGDPVGRLQTVARGLAKANIVVVTGTLESHLLPLKDLHIQDWVQSHYTLYHLLARVLCPSLNTFTALYADKQTPPVVVLQGTSTAIMDVFSGVLMPYLAIKQGKPMTDHDELGHLMDTVLAELGAHRLDDEAYDLLRQRGSLHLRKMLNTTVKHVSLTAFDPLLLERINGSSETALVDSRSQQTLVRDLYALPGSTLPATATQEMFVFNVMLGPEIDHDEQNGTRNTGAGDEEQDRTP